MDSLTERDRRRVWHPYTQHSWDEVPLEIVSARGAYLRTSSGESLLDGISSWWVNLHGHCHPRIASAIARQAETLDHVLFAGCTHEPGVQLVERIAGYLASRGSGPWRGFYSDNGSTAVEVALKMAYQTHLHRGDARRQRFLALGGAYHGDTLGAMSAGERAGFHEAFAPLLFGVDFVPAGDLPALEAYLVKHGSECAAFIFEPLVQGACGMRVHSAEYLRAAVALCRDHRALAIADEVFTGFGRTGPELFAHLRAGIRPDLICLSKGITGGTLPLALTLAGEDIYRAFLDPSLGRAFLHGHSYTANPIACAAGLASWELLTEPGTISAIARIERETEAWRREMASHPRVADARALGTIGAIELRTKEEAAAGSAYFSNLGRRLRQSGRGRGVLLRPLGNVLYAVPPYCVTSEELGRIHAAIAASIDEA